MFTNKSFAIVGAAILALTLAACGNGAETTNTGGGGPATQQTVNLEDANVVASGAFEGRSDHITTGGVSLVSTDTGYQLVFAANFSLDGAPDPKVGFGNAGEYVAASQVAALQNKTGAQTYSLPASFSPSDYSEVYVWCEQFSVPLGVATLSPAQ